VGADARSAGFADAVHAAPAGRTALYFNPAGMSLFRTYEVGTGYDLTYTPDQQTHTLGASIVDSSTNDVFALGVGYAFDVIPTLANAPTHSGDSDALARQAHHLRVGMSSGYQSESFSILAGVAYQWLSLNLDETCESNHHNLDAGILISGGQFLQIGVTGHNLLKEDPLAEMPRQMGVGLAIPVDLFIGAFDVLIDFETRDKPTARYAVGAQYTAAQILPLRVGFQLDTIADTKRITAGIGYTEPLFSVDLGYQHNLMNTDEVIVGIDLRFVVP